MEDELKPVLPMRITMSDVMTETKPRQYDNARTRPAMLKIDSGGP